VKKLYSVNAIKKLYSVNAKRTNYFFQAVMGVSSVVNLVIFHVSAPKAEDREGHEVAAGDAGDDEDHAEVVEGVFLWICGDS
jgi:hypothetical protein